MKKNVIVCDVCKKECTDSVEFIFTATELSGAYDMCEPCAEKVMNLHAQGVEKKPEPNSDLTLLDVSKLPETCYARRYLRKFASGHMPAQDGAITSIMRSCHDHLRYDQKTDSWYAVKNPPVALGMLIICTQRPEILAVSVNTFCDKIAHELTCSPSTIRAYRAILTTDNRNRV